MNLKSKEFLLENIPHSIDYSAVHGGSLYTGIYNNNRATHAVIVHSHGDVKECLQDFIDESDADDFPIQDLKEIGLVDERIKRFPDLLSCDESGDIKLNSNVFDNFFVFY